MPSNSLQRERRERRSSRLAAAAAIAALAALPVVAQRDLEPRIERLPPRVVAPPPPDPATLPVQLALDHDTADGRFGFGAVTSQQFLWIDAFDRSAWSAFDLRQVWVLFPAQADIAVGDPFQIAVWRDPDGNPANGAVLLATYPARVGAVDGVTFTVVTLPTPLLVADPGDLLVGLVDRWVASGVDPAARQAALDLTAPSTRSWVALWTSDPPDPPQLPGNLLTARLDTLLPPDQTGAFLIRAYGSAAQTVEVPALGRAGRAALPLLLAAAGVVALALRRGR